MRTFGIGLRMTSLGLVTLLAGCGYAKRADVDRQMTQLRQDMESADQGLSSQITQVKGQVTDLQSRTTALEHDLQSMRSEFSARIQSLENMLAFDVPVHFEFDKADVRPSDEAVLTRFANVVKQYYPGAMVTVEGFTDAAGSASYNMRLGKKRADAVKQYLVTAAGISEDQIRTVSYGEARNRLVAPKAWGADNPDGMKNRRVTLVIDFSNMASAPRPVTSDLELNN